MTGPTLDCLDERRRRDVRRRHYSGLDYLEVSDNQRTLKVYFLGAAPEGLTADNVRITGGRRIRGIRVTGVKVCPQVDPELDNCLIVTVDRLGDFSTYTLCLVDLPEDAPFDPRYRCLDFTFKAACPTDLDCKPEPVCPPEERREPEISYLAKDYASFRRLIFDRLAAVMPEWTESHVPDLGVTLVELLAYVGDRLSYHQDAVATEAYLDTARQRISVRRHARLVDYRMHEGCNARAWLHLETSGDGDLPAEQVAFLTGFDGAPEAEDRLLTWNDLREVPASRYEVFEPVLAGGSDPAAADDPETPKPSLRLYRAHNEIHLYTWGDAECCLPRGATSATLVDGPPSPPPDDGDEEPCDDEKGVDKGEGKGHKSRESSERSGDGRYRYQDDSPEQQPPAERVLHLQVGDVLIFEEVVGPKTGDPDDADPARRHAVRLRRIEPVVDALYGQPLLEIGWAEEDALPFPLCLSTLGPPPDCALVENVSVARGNVVLVDHGRRRGPNTVGCVPQEREEVRCEGEGRPSDLVRHPGRFRPRLASGSLTFCQPLRPGAPAGETVQQNPREAVPWIDLSSRFNPKGLHEGPDGRDEEVTPGPEAEGATAHASEETAPKAKPEEDSAAHETAASDPPEPDSPGPGQRWTARRDLLASSRDDRHYVAEIDDLGRAHLRFGDGELGRLPEAGHAFEARYRTGNGPAGNVGADAITLAVTEGLVSGVTVKPRNPLPAVGGTAPEPITEAKLFAPHAFRQELARAVTAADYARLAERHAGVQRAAAELRWNGSWYEVRVAVDPLGQAEADPVLLEETERHLYPFRRIGHDLAVRPARYVPLDLVMKVCVEPDFLRGHVKAALLERFGTRRLPDGSLGFFHPDALTFGQSISLSRLVAAAQALPGVESVAVTKLERFFEGPAGEIEQGVLPIGPLEIARLDADPDFPENGCIRFELGGGR